MLCAVNVERLKMRKTKDVVCRKCGKPNHVPKEATYRDLGEAVCERKIKLYGGFCVRHWT